MTETTIQMRVMFALEHIALSLFAEAIKQPNAARQIIHGKECSVCAPQIPEEPDTTISRPKVVEHHKGKRN